MHPANLEADASRIVLLDYTNYKGIRREYKVIPHNLEFGHHLPFHVKEQWLLVGTDVERNVVRKFAMKDIHSWRPQ